MTRGSLTCHLEQGTVATVARRDSEAEPRLGEPVT